MDAIPYTTLRDPRGRMDRACEDQTPIIVTRKASASVATISLDDYEAHEDTSYLLRSPKNARRLLESIAELEAGGGTELDSPCEGRRSRSMLGTPTSIGEDRSQVVQRVNAHITDIQRHRVRRDRQAGGAQARLVWLLVSPHR